MHRLPNDALCVVHDFAGPRTALPLVSRRLRRVTAPRAVRVRPVLLGVADGNRATSGSGWLDRVSRVVVPCDFCVVPANVALLVDGALPWLPRAALVEWNPHGPPPAAIVARTTVVRTCWPRHVLDACVSAVRVCVCGPPANATAADEAAADDCPAPVLARTTHLSGRACPRFAGACGALRDLRITRGTTSDALVAVLAARGAGLVRLDVESVVGPPEAVAGAIAAFCGGLRHLTAPLAVLAAVAGSCLETVCVVLGPRRAGAGAAWGAVLGLPRLRRLTVRGELNRAHWPRGAGPGHRLPAALPVAPGVVRADVVTGAGALCPLGAARLLALLPALRDLRLAGPGVRWGLCTDAAGPLPALRRVCLAPNTGGPVGGAALRSVARAAPGLVLLVCEAPPFGRHGSGKGGLPVFPCLRDMALPAGSGRHPEVARWWAAGRRCLPACAAVPCPTSPRHSATRTTRFAR